MSSTYFANAKNDGGVMYENHYDSRRRNLKVIFRGKHNEKNSYARADEHREL